LRIGKAAAHKNHASLPPSPALSPYFVGRDDLVKEIVDYHFMKPPHSKSHRVTVLVGVAGIGKTQIAVKVHSEFMQR
jgi:Cdc6-like AAA superfamily ATPase